MRRAKKYKNSSSAQHYDQIRFRFHTAWVTLSRRALRPAMEEVASIADAGGHGTRVEAASTGAYPQYPSKPPRRLTGVISASGHNRPSRSLSEAREIDVTFVALAT
jgi:hypothetical protein